jgi:hypothetical protein
VPGLLAAMPFTLLCEWMAFFAIEQEDEREQLAAARADAMHQSLKRERTR